MRRRSVVVLFVAFGLLGGSVASADGATPCGAHGVLSATSTHFSCGYTNVGEDSFSVPAGVASVSVVAVGAPGGRGGLYNSASASGAPGGLGAVATVPSLLVAGHGALYIEVGGAGGHGVGTYPSTGLCPAGAAGVGGGGVGGNARCFAGSGGGGGGESDVRTQPASSGGLTGAAGDPRLVVAGGGGGGGGEYYTAGGVGGSSGGSAAGGGGAGGSVDCMHPMSGVPGHSGETGAGGGAGGVALNPMYCLSNVFDGSAGTATGGGAGGDGNTANSTGPGGGGGGYFGGGGGVAVGGVDAPGGGGGSSYAPAGATFATAPAAASSASVTISWELPAPTATILTPTNGTTYTEAQVAHSSFSCTEAASGPGIRSCLDQNGNASGAVIDTSTVGAHTLTVTATSHDGLTGTASVTYTVTSPPRPAATTAPAISGTAKAAHVLSCSPGTWANQPTAFAYQWSRDGTPIAGATAAGYTVQVLDEGNTLTCTATATNLAGNTSATSDPVAVAVPFVARCPAATGEISGRSLGLVRLGMTHAQARKAYKRSSNRRLPNQDFFCLTPAGIRVWYATTKLASSLPETERKHIIGRLMVALTANPHYAIEGIRPGATITAAAARLHLEIAFHIGRNDWYLAPNPTATTILKVRHGLVQEIGIANPQLTQRRTAQRTFLTSFS